MLARPKEGVATFGDLLLQAFVYHLSRVEKRNHKRRSNTHFGEGCYQQVVSWRAGLVDVALVQISAQSEIVGVGELR